MLLHLLLEVLVEVDGYLMSNKKDVIEIEKNIVSFNDDVGQ